MVAAKAHAIAENIMKLVRFDDGKTGLMVQLAAGPHVIDVIGSLGVLSPGDPISQGVLNGILKNKGSWGSVDRALESGPNWIATTGVVGVSEFRPTGSGHLPC